MSEGDAEPRQKRWWKWPLTAVVIPVVLEQLLTTWVAPYTIYIKSPSTAMHSIVSLAYRPLKLLFGWTAQWSDVMAASTGPAGPIDAWLPFLVFTWLVLKLSLYNQSLEKFLDQASQDLSNHVVLENDPVAQKVAAFGRKLKRRIKVALRVSTLVAFAMINIASTIVIRGVATRQLWDQRMTMLKPFITQQQYDVLNAAFANIFSTQDTTNVYSSFNAVVERERKRSDALAKSGQQSTSDLIPRAMPLPPEY